MGRLLLDVGEGYITFPPRGHGVELVKEKTINEKLVEREGH